MSAMNALTLATSVHYPDNDGNPMSDNTKQMRWIVLLYSNIAWLMRQAADVFVAADLLWYPVEGYPKIRAAPDVMVVFGRPKGDRGSYRQWEEADVPVTVAFEVLSPGNTVPEMIDKLTFYEDHGVEEYYVFDPDNNRLLVYLRRGELLLRHRQVDGFTSPRLGIRFDFSGEEMVVRHPDGQPFRTLEDVSAARDQAERRADEEARRADEEARRAARVVELSRKARRQEANPQELAELERLESEILPTA